MKFLLTLLLLLPLSLQAVNISEWTFDTGDGSVWESGGDCNDGMPPPTGTNSSANCSGGTRSEVFSGQGWNGGAALRTLPIDNCPDASPNFNDNIGCNFNLCRTDACPGQPGQNPVTINIQDGSTTYFRMWIKIESGFNWSNQNKAKGIRGTHLTGGTVFTGYVNASGFSPFEDCVTGSGVVCTPNPTPMRELLNWDMAPPCLNGAPDANTQPACTTWNEYIIKIKWQTGENSDGEHCLYVNGIERECATGWKLVTGIPTIGLDWGGLYFAEQFYQNGSGTVWVDDLRSDTTLVSNCTPNGSDGCTEISGGGFNFRRESGANRGVRRGIRRGVR